MAAFLFLGCSPKALNGLFGFGSTSAEFSVTQKLVQEGSSTQIEVVLSKAAEEGSSFDIILGGTASNSDHNLSSTTISIPSGNTHVLIVLLTNDNLVRDGDRTLTITLSNPSKLSLGSKLTQTITIEDDDTDYDPANLTATADNTTSITLDWDASGTGVEVGYRIAYLAGVMSPIDCSSGTTISEGAITGTSHQVTGLSSSTLYSFRVCGIDGSTPSVESIGATATESASVPVANPSLYIGYNDEGSGTMGDPYNLYTKDQLKDIGISGCNGGTTVACGAYFEIKNNINLNSEVFTPIGTCTNAFTGNFNGGGFTVSNLSINLLSQDCVGFIGKADGATITAVVLANGDVQGNQYVGALVGDAAAASVISNSTASGVVDADTADVGGLIGRYSGTGNITSSSTSVNVGTRYVVNSSGGLAGAVSTTGSITNSYAIGSVIGAAYVGGFAGIINGGTSVSNSYATGSVSATGTGAGGFAGVTDETASFASIYSTSNVTSIQSEVGGLIGSHYSDGAVTSSYATGKVKGDQYVGGFIGNSYGDTLISNSYALGDVEGGSDSVGGFIGRIFSGASTVSNSWAAGRVRSVGQAVGGFGGAIYATVSDCFAVGFVESSNGAVGGFAGYIDSLSTVTRSYSNGNVYSVGSGQHVGGFVGYLTGSISDSYATGNTYTNIQYSGGFVGGAFGGSANISNSFSTGNIRGGGNTGGFAGNLNTSGSIQYNYSTGNVIGSPVSGGFVSSVGGAGGTITDNFAMGSVTYGGANAGAFAGNFSAGTASRNYCLGSVNGSTNINAFIGSFTGGSLNYNYWNSDTTPSLNGTEGVASVANQYEPKTTAELQLAATFESNWDYSNVWVQVNKNSYPYHRSSAEGQCNLNSHESTYNAIGSGTKASPYIICNLAQWKDLASNGCGAGGATDCDKDYILGSDIDFQNNLYVIAKDLDFSGTFDGRNKAVYNVFYNSGDSFQGLFAQLSGTVKNLKGYGFNITSTDSNVGSIAGRSDGGKVINVHVAGSISGADLVGGLIGRLSNSAALYDAIVLNSSFVGTVTSSGNEVGGIIGGQIFGTEAGAFISQVSVDASISATEANAGGIIGTGGGVIRNARTSGSVSADTAVGGLIGQNHAVDQFVYESVSSMDVTGISDYVGGLIGSGSNVGRVSDIFDSYSYANNVMGGSSDFVGGIAGIRVSIFNTHADNSVTGSGSFVGGLVGAGGGTFNFWNIDNGVTKGRGDGVGSEPGIFQSLTDSTIDDDAAYTGAGWDTTNTWLLRTDVSPPDLRWTIHPSCQSLPTAVTYNSIGSGSASSPYRICFREQILDLALNGCNIGGSTAGCDKAYMLMNDIDLKNVAMIPIGEGTVFSGSFEGNNNALVNLNISGGAADYRGLFKNLQGNVSNLKVLRATVSGSGESLGILAGEAYNVVAKNILVTGTLSGGAGNGVGGVMGTAYTFNKSSRYEDIRFIGSVSSTGNNVGGIFGDLSSSQAFANKLYAYGSVTGISRVGGIAGYASSIVMNSSANVTVSTSTGHSVGGFFGLNYGMAYNSYSLGKVVGGSDNAYGGFSGTIFGGVFDSFSMVELNSLNSNAGGMIGTLMNGALSYNNFSAGTLSGGATNGFAGNPLGVFSYNFYDSTESKDSSQNITNQIQPLSTANMQSSANFTGWDFTDVWNTVPGSYHSHRSGFLGAFSSSVLPSALSEGESYIDTTGLVALYHFDESPIDESTNNLIADSTTASVSNGTVYTGDTTIDKSTAGVINGAMDFDGTGDYVDVGNPAELQLTGAMTVTAWVYLDTVNNLYIFTKSLSPPNRGWDLSGNVSGSNFNVEFRIASDDSTHMSSGVSQDLFVNKWYHVVGVYRPSESIEIYVDGVLENTNTASIPATQYGGSTASAFIGARPSEPSYLDGKIDEVSLWSRALTPKEIYYLYSRRKYSY